jgi:hypothetical protein
MTKRTMRMNEIIEFNNALETAVRQKEPAPGTLVYWAGYQLGKLKSAMRYFIDAMKDPEIMEYEKDRQSCTSNAAVYDLQNGKHLTAWAKVQACNEEEKEVIIRDIPEKAFEENLSPAWGKAISFAIEALEG